jgi:hypothetical protein
LAARDTHARPSTARDRSTTTLDELSRHGAAPRLRHDAHCSCEEPAMIRIAHVLCPVDFSAISCRALNHATALAQWYDATLTGAERIPGHARDGRAAARARRQIAE